jgi:hypothetical protein
MIRFYNKKYKDITFRLDNKVLFLSRYIRTRRLSKKLINKFLSPFRIIIYIGKNAYKLDLLSKYGRIYSTFLVVFLEPYRRRDGVEPPAPINIKGEEE